MYKIILSFDNLPLASVQTMVYTYYSLDECRKQIPILKDKYISMGCRITKLRIYKTEEIQDSEQI